MFILRNLMNSVNSTLDAVFSRQNSSANDHQPTNGTARLEVPAGEPKKVRHSEGVMPKRGSNDLLVCDRIQFVWVPRKSLQIRGVVPVKEVVEE